MNSSQDAQAQALQEEFNGIKQRLSEDVETLTRQLDAERKRLSSALAEFARWIDSSLQVGGARAPSAAPPATSEAPARPMATPPPAPAPLHDRESTAQVLNFEQPSRDDRP